MKLKTIFFITAAILLTGCSSGTDSSFGGQALSDFDYEIIENKIVMQDIDKAKRNFEVKASYESEGTEYEVDLSKFQVGIGDSSVQNIAFCDGISELFTAVFNSCDVKTIYLPQSLSVIYDNTLDYLYADEEKVKIYYGGSEEEWSSIYQLYESKDIGSIIDSSADQEEKAGEIGSAIAEKLNDMMDENDELDYELIFDTTIDEYKKIVMGE